MLQFYQFLYQITPIFLTNGIAGTIPGSILPLLTLVNPAAYNALFSGGNVSFNVDDYFAIFQPAPGGTLVQQQLAEYPFANLNVAANAIVKQPIEVSMIMMTPMKTKMAWAVKNATMTALKYALDNHNNLGGTYTVFTPAFIYYDMLMLSLTDISTAQTPIPQNTWRWDFRKPLVTMQDLIFAENNLNTKITAGVPTPADTTNALTGLGLSAATINQLEATMATVPQVTIGGAYSS
jgi:hypothetical protein